MEKATDCTRCIDVDNSCKQCLYDSLSKVIIIIIIIRNLYSAIMPLGGYRGAGGTGG